MLAQAYRKYRQTEQHVHLARGRGERLPFPPDTFDLVTIGQAIHWFRDSLQALVPELRRVLRPGGWLTIISKYPSPQEPCRPFYEYLLHKYTSAGDPPQYRLIPYIVVGHLGSLERGGFTDYERVVFQWDMAVSVEDYLRGHASDPDVLALPEADRARFMAELEREVRRHADGGRLRESYFDYCIMARCTA
jgi:ubiquinone/menaquinone biosynthesis C-methylase UbiE